MLNWPTGSYLVLRCTTPVKKVDLYAVGYKYSKGQIMVFISTKGAGLTTEGAPYHAKYTDLHQNRLEREIFRPALISEYFQDANMVDMHNHARQGELGLERSWTTRDCWFRLACTFIGMNLTDTWKAYKYHFSDETLKVRTFADRMAKQLIEKPYSKEEKERFIRPMASIPTNIVSPTSSRASEPMSPISMCTDIGSSHEFRITTQMEGNNHARTKRRTCAAPGCRDKTSMECSNPICRSITVQNNRFSSKGVFFCSKHIYIHHNAFMHRQKENGGTD